MGSPWASEQILVHELPVAPGPTCPGSGLTRPLAGPGSARGRDSCGLPDPVAPVRDIHYESPGVPDPPPYSGFRDSDMNHELMRNYCEETRETRHRVVTTHVRRCSVGSHAVLRVLSKSNSKSLGDTSIKG